MHEPPIRRKDAGMRAFGFLFLFASLSAARTNYWAPLNPPRAHYFVDERFVSDPPHLEGSETIRFRNITDRPIGRIAFLWDGEIPSVRANGVAAAPASGKPSTSLFDLPADLQPGAEVELAVEFRTPVDWDRKTDSAITSFLNPLLWWGFGTLDDYEVRLQAPAGYALGTSGRYDPKSASYRADNIRAFGLFVGKGYETEDADAGEVRIRAVFTPPGRACAELLVKTAADVIAFYRQQFGFYPHRSLTIVPGMDFPAGGYPPASGLVVVHGQQHLADRPEAFWRWITAHEVGHMYWSNYVLAQGPESLSWLMIGLGLHADRGYRRARDISNAGNLEQNYVNGVRQGLDTTMDLTEDQENAIQWDFNNVVEHGKSIAMVNALESVVGTETFARIYLRCLKDYAGKQLGWREFQRVSEIESGQDLGWFFDQWIRSPANADYRATVQACSPQGTKFDCTVRVERAGTMHMPVTLAARFEDGSEQHLHTDRLADVDELKFQASSSLKSVVVEPEAAIALAEAPSQAQRKVMAKISQMPWVGVGQSALDAYHETNNAKVEDAQTRFKLALLLFDGHYYAEALEMTKSLAETDSDYRFAALVWEGHLLDLLAHRAEAIACYQEALKVPGSPSMKHSQYNLVINRGWVEARLKTPFQRE
jgi:aminopeptidase N